MFTKWQAVKKTRDRLRLFKLTLNPGGCGFSYFDGLCGNDA
jgi:hypothetical protein